MTAGAYPDCHVVIRAAGERTEGVCARLAAREVGPERVTVIHEVPFSKAVRRGFEIGVEAGRAWTLCLDADVLLDSGAIAALCTAAEAERGGREDLFEVDALVADKLLGQIRPAGVHLYRTACLPEALEEADFNEKKRRPESYVKRMMRKRGKRIIEVPLVAGLHDFEQYYRDIFRKIFVHTRKHDRYMPYAARYWDRMAVLDDDLRVAWLSRCLSQAINEKTDFTGIPDAERIRIDMRIFPRNIEAILTPAGLSEKEPLPDEGLTPEAVRAMLDAFEVSPEFLHDRPLIEAIGANRRRRLWAHLQVLGPVGLVRHQTGRMLGAAGRRLAGKEA